MHYAVIQKFHGLPTCKFSTFVMMSADLACKKVGLNQIRSVYVCLVQGALGEGWGGVGEVLSCSG